MKAKIPEKRIYFPNYAHIWVTAKKTLFKNLKNVKETLRTAARKKNDNSVAWQMVSKSSP